MSINMTPESLGIHRVLEPIGCFPQSAWKIDNSMKPYPSELLIDVLGLNIDATSYKQLCESTNNDQNAIKANILKIVNTRGKLHNPVTGSGGMLLGQVLQKGQNYSGTIALGDKILTLASLSLTPLYIEEIINLELNNPQIKIKGKAILFETASFVKAPDDISEQVALAVCDVCGAPAWVFNEIEKGSSVTVIGGGGKSGILSIIAAHKAGASQIICIDISKTARAQLKRLKIPVTYIEADATKPYEILINTPVKSDFTINCSNVGNTEMASILITKETGTIMFFSTATSFNKAMLGAEGISSGVKMQIGNGYYGGHAEFAFSLVREYPLLNEILK